jgi:SAM-dependent methyltransferase
MSGPSPEFWQSRFAEGVLPWDRGTANPQLLKWLDAGLLASGEQVIVPGCGQGWEVAALARHGMQVIGVDFASGALAMCRKLVESEVRDAGLVTLVEANVLHWQPLRAVDAVFEQTCLCALYPDYWMHYAAQVHAWLKPGGKLLALFMQVPAKSEFPQGFIEGPPYHCDIHAMRAIFPATQWLWPKPPYEHVVQSSGLGLLELAVILERK